MKRLVPITLDSGYLRTRFGQHVGAQAVPTAGEPVKPFRKILMVGALVNGDQELSVEDASYLERLLQLLKACDIPIVTDFEVQVINLAYGHDFLIDPPDADIIAICMISDPPPPDEDLNIGLSFLRHLIPDLSISPHHHEPGIWIKRAKESGAQLVLSFGSSFGINGEHFAGHDFVPVQRDGLGDVMLATPVMANHCNLS